MEQEIKIGIKIEVVIIDTLEKIEAAFELHNQKSLKGEAIKCIYCCK